jgi:hypothetical protein
MGGTCWTHGREDLKKAYRVLAGNPEEMGLIGKPMPRWEVNIKIECQEIGWEGMDWIHLAQDRHK